MISEQTAPQPGFVARAIQKVGGGRAPAALFDQALVSGANFLTNVLLARTFGIKEYGIFALLWIGVLFANSLQYALIVTPMLSVGPKQEEDDRPAYYGAVLVQEILFASMAGLVMLLGVRFSTIIHPEWGIADMAWPVSLATTAYMLQDYLRRYFFCTRQSKRALGTDVLSYFTQLPILFWMSRTHVLGVANALWVIALTSLIGFLAYMVVYERITLGLRSTRDVFLRHWRISRWVVPTAFMQWGASNLFALAAPIYYGAAASAMLRAAQNIVAVAHIWFLGLDNVVPAEAARQMHRNGVDGVLRYIRKVILTWGGITFAFTGIIALFPTFWLHLTYGNKYSSEGTVLRLYALLYLVLFLSSPLRAGLQAIEYTKPIFWAYPLLIAFSVTLAGPMARTLGLNGVILGMTATHLIFQSFVGIAFWLRIRKIRRIAAAEKAQSDDLAVVGFDLRESVAAGNTKES